jgi:hypothetical protein
MSSRRASLATALASAVPFLALVFLMEVERGRLRGVLTPRFAGWAVEDGPIEMGTALLAAAAAAAWWVAVLRARADARMRQPVRLLITGALALFLLFFAGEEIAWGQRLLGYRSPGFFRSHNTQSELTLHNIEGVNERVNGVLIIGTFIYGVLLPLAARRLPAVAALAARFGPPLPPVRYAPFFALAIAYRGIYFNKELYGNDAQEGLEFLVAFAFLAAGLHGAARPRDLAG